jgi:uncharacterized OB-fold protein
MNLEKPIPVLRCSACGALGIPPQYVCRNCENTLFEQTVVSGQAKVYSHTTIRIAPILFRDEVPYQIIIADLAPGMRVTGRLIQDKEYNILIGQNLLFDRLDETGYWFRIVESSS